MKSEVPGPSGFSTVLVLTHDQPLSSCYWNSLPAWSSYASGTLRGGGSAAMGAPELWAILVAIWGAVDGLKRRANYILNEGPSHIPNSN